jgi:hypothetical protein
MSPPSPHEPARRDDAGVLPAASGDSTRDDGGERPTSARGVPAAKGFVLEVSAARPKGVGDAATGRALRVDALGPAEEVAEVAANDGGSAPAISPAAARDVPLGDLLETDDALATLEPLPAEGLAVIPRKRGRVNRRRGRAPHSAPRALPASAASPLNARLAETPADMTAGPSQPRRRWSAWSLSFVVHGLMLACLSLVTIAQIVPRDEMDLVMASAEADDLQFAEAEANPDAAAGDEQVAGMLTEATAQVIDPGTPTLGSELGAGLVGDLTDAAFASGGGGGAESGPFGGRGGAGGLFGDGTGGLAAFGSGLGGEATARFFGTTIEGRRVVFVLDNSGSMQQGRLETVVAELLRCVKSLDEKKQEFYVIFYSDQAYPLFFPHPAAGYVRPSPRNQARLAAWLDTVELCLGDAVVDALSAAISIEPDTVFLLSDGRIQGEKKMAFLLQAGGGRFPIHTIGVGLSAGASTSRDNLQQIAAANGGDFREADVPAEMKQLAREQPRPYHNKGPGPIWGRSVKAWGGR